MGSRRYGPSSRMLRRLPRRNPNERCGTQREPEVRGDNRARHGRFSRRPTHRCRRGLEFGTFGAIAEFTRDADEMVILDRRDETVSAVTARGGIRIRAKADLRAIASESLTPSAWNQRVALCLPQSACAMNARTVLTEVGPDGDALRAADRSAVLFDLGLGALQIDACVRSADPEIIAALRECCGTSLFAAGDGAMHVILASNPHRVFISRVGRIEVFQPIPTPDGTSPEGPHTHVLPKLLGSGRTHAATEPIPVGWIPCAHF
jgi:hypothetical protein